MKNTILGILEYIQYVGPINYKSFYVSESYRPFLIKEMVSSGLIKKISNENWDITEKGLNILRNKKIIT